MLEIYTNDIVELAFNWSHAHIFIFSLRSAEDEKYDQVLESVLVGPVNIGSYRFVFQVCKLLCSIYLSGGGSEHTRRHLFRNLISMFMHKI